MKVSNPVSDKSIVIDNEIFKLLDPFTQAVYQVLIDEGKAVISDRTEVH